MTMCDLPALPAYHPNSELGSRRGYYPNLDEIHLEALSSLRTLVNETKLDISDGQEHDTLKLLRFLRARQFNVSKAFDMLRNDVEWRADESRQDMQTKKAEDILQNDLATIYKYFPTWMQGFDKQCRPISWRQFGKFEIWNLLKLTSMENLILFHGWEGEQALRLMHEQSVKTGYNIETFVVVVDAAGWGMHLATSDAFTFIKGMATIDSDHYPERLGRLFVINAPYALSFAWKIVSAFLDDVTKAKISIHSSRSEWLPKLLEVMDIDNIPQQYGGEAPDLGPEEALASMNPTVKPQQSEPSV